jgi:hypothetical protein
MGKRIPLEDRFWTKVDKCGPVPEHVPELGPCWLWMASRFAGGYGRIDVNKHSKVAHRVAWGLVKGDIPDGLLALHRCDNPPCVNPDHLFLGTHKDNTQDALSKGRFAVGDRNAFHLYKDRVLAGQLKRLEAGPINHPSGDAHYLCKIPDAELPVIFERAAAGDYQYVIAADYGVTQGTISKILTNRTRKWYKNGTN